MNCNEFKTQFESQSDLSNEQKTHVEMCEECNVFHREEVQLAAMLGGLPVVETPKDFEFGFKSKLAESKPTSVISPIWQILRYALPVTAAALIFGFVFVNSSFFVDQESRTQVAEKEAFNKKDDNANPVIEVEVGTPEQTKDLVAEGNNQSEKPVVSVPNDSKKDLHREPEKELAQVDPKNKKPASGDEGGIISKDFGSEKESQPRILDKDSALTEGKSINPPGIEPEKIIRDPRMGASAKEFSAEAVLSQLGIETSKANGHLKVVAVRKNSAGSRSGVKVGDIVTAIDGKKITGRTLSTRRIKGSSIGVVRDNKAITITIKNR